MSRLIICGAGGHARVVADAVRAAAEEEIVGFLVEEGYARPSADMPLIGGAGLLQRLRADGVTRGFVAIGDAAARLRLDVLLRRNGFELATVIHPRAVVAGDAVIEDGAFIAAGAVVGPGTRIGRLAIVNTAAVVDHDCVVGVAAHVCPGATLAGAIIVEEGAWVGVGATVIEGRTIGGGAFVGAGAVVIGDVPAGRKVAGVPARDIGPAVPLD